MTSEELKQLKKGDEIFIRARYKEIIGDGDVLFSHSARNVWDKVVKTNGYTHPENVILPPSAPKYDPCRIFKKGDRVRIVKYAGRYYDTFWVPFVGSEMYVGTSETAYSLPEVKTANGLRPIEPAYLELVTPVEELEPYYVKDDGTHYVVGKRPEEPEIVYLAEYSKDRHPHAKEAAEAECARLNAEYRKEQK